MFLHVEKIHTLSTRSHRIVSTTIEVGSPKPVRVFDICSEMRSDSELFCFCCARFRERFLD